MRINVHFFVITIVACIALLTDIILYTLNISYNISVIAAILIMAIALVLILKSKKIKLETNFDKSDFLFYLFLGLIFIKRIVIPDFSYDTLNYHIYLQENPFIDKINFDFFPARTLNSFLFPLGDRMFYLFRNIFGYRLGTILSYYASIVMFYQVKLIVQNVRNDVDKFWKCLISSAILLIFSLNEWIGSYYVDILSAMYVLQLFLCAITVTDMFTNKRNLYLISLICGISVGIKLPNLLIEIPILLYLLKNNLKDIKNLKLHDIILTIILFVLPFLVYMIDNIKQTGSPIFPYYNSIFKSQFFDNINWQDPNFGVPNFALSLIWPIIVTLLPTKGYEIIFEVDTIFGIGFICAIMYIIKKIRAGEKNNKNVSMILLLLAMTIIWSNFMMGYVRYAIELVVLYWILFSLMIYNLNCSSKIELNSFVTICFIICLFFNTIMYDFDIIIFSETNNYSRGNYTDNFSKIFHDRNDKKIHIDGVWVAIGDSSAVESLVREEGTPIYNLNKKYLGTSKINVQMYNEKVKYDKLYTIIEKDKIIRMINNLNENNLKITNIRKIEEELNFKDVNNIYYLAEIIYDENFEENIIQNVNDEIFINGMKL